jgi:NADH-quinone oxidoreductase subunit G
MIDSRGDKSTIDIFPGEPINNPLASNVIDLCPVGSLLDKDFLFAQRVWFLKRTAGIDPFTSSGDNIWVEHNQGRVYRIKPRTNMDINTWWITDEVRYGWKFVHSENRLVAPTRKQHGVQVDATWTRLWPPVAALLVIIATRHALFGLLAGGLALFGFVGRRRRAAA